MIPWLIGLGLAALGGALVVAYWDEIIDWLSDFIPKIKKAFNSLKKNIAYAGAMFIQKCKDAYSKIMHKLYYKENGQWIEETTTRTIPESQVPAHIRRKLDIQEKEVTEEFKEILQMEI